MRTVKVIFAGGGTGGHLIPALAIADRLKSRLEPIHKTDFIFVGTKRGLEYRMKDKLGYPLIIINIRGMARSLTLSNLLVPFLLIGAILRSILLMAKFSPDIVVGTGGYVMGPILIAAIITGRRRVIQEQNSFPGVTTRWLASRVDKVFLGFGDAVMHLGSTKNTLETGNPIKEIIGKIPKADGRKFFEVPQDSKVILILGGSQGAATINRNILRGLDKFPAACHIIWQTGERDYKEVAAQAGGKAKGRSLFPFTDRIEMAYAAADLVIARAGALTLAEILAAGLPSILVPYPFAAGDHQRKNAESFKSGGASIIFDDSQLGEISLLDQAVSLFENRRQVQMTAAAIAIRDKKNKNAADLITDEILKLIDIPGSSA